MPWHAPGPKHCTDAGASEFHRVSLILWSSSTYQSLQSICVGIYFCHCPQHMIHKIYYIYDFGKKREVVLEASIYYSLL